MGDFVIEIIMDDAKDSVTNRGHVICVFSGHDWSSISCETNFTTNIFFPGYGEARSNAALRISVSGSLASPQDGRARNGAAVACNISDAEALSSWSSF
jgi:hypothetical protein